MYAQTEKTVERDDDVMAVALVNRSYQYRLLQRLVGAEPTAALLEELLSGHASWSLTMFLDQGSTTEVSNLLETLRSGFLRAPRDITGRVRDEYVRCFLGPNTLPSPPWESMHRGSEKMLFNEVTLEVRRSYARAGMRPSEYPRVADDHLAIELDFMAQLAQRSEIALLDQRCGQALEAIRMQQDFLDEHLCCWLGSFLRGLESGGQAHFYAPIIRISQLIVETDRTLLTELERELLRAIERKSYAKD